MNHNPSVSRIDGIGLRDTTLFLRVNYNNFSMESNSTGPLRYEATSRLFEKGLNPAEVATITGHKDPKILMRYTHLRAEDLGGEIGLVTPNTPPAL